MKKTRSDDCTVFTPRKRKKKSRFPEATRAKQKEKACKTTKLSLYETHNYSHDKISRLPKVYRKAKVIKFEKYFHHISYYLLKELGKMPPL